MSRIYVIQVTPGSENKVQARLEREGIAAYAPKRELDIRRGGMWTREIKLLFPSYVFIDCEYTPELHHAVIGTEDVLRWLGKPTPIKDSEEAFMRLLINGGRSIPQSSAAVDNDMNVTVKDGWLLDKQEYVTGWDLRKHKALLELPFGGKLHRTSVGVHFTKS